MYAKGVCVCWIKLKTKGMMMLFFGLVNMFLFLRSSVVVVVVVVFVFDDLMSVFGQRVLCFPTSLPLIQLDLFAKQRGTHNGEVLEILGGAANNFCQKVVPLKPGFPHPLVVFEG